MAQQLQQVSFPNHTLLLHQRNLASHVSLHTIGREEQTDVDLIDGTAGELYLHTLLLRHIS